ncbi:purine-cytosine permease family protein [Streptosporangium sp. NBC_01756]|uniref:purine-cytosine permease family protein n=1 Tax=Streptosporangium sp. NBC_01756 TaxID=2975950 RepID=UPI002DDC8ABF|nr:cytosine permease [Streptosporangium sp. NBC_01756]WSC85231.1 cytosine permease [Streptosporangium sp. NBC_01756]
MTTEVEPESHPSDLDDHALEAVPSNRRQSLTQMIVVQIGWNISVSSFLVGGVVGGGTSFGEGMAAIVVGNLVLVAVAALIGLVGYRTGLSSYLTARVVFGRQGAVLVSLLLGVVAMGFIGVLMDTWSGAVHKLIPAVPPWAFILVFGAAITTTAIFGFKGMAKFSAIAVPIEIAIALVALFKIGASGGGFAEVVTQQPVVPIGFAAAVGAVISTWITGAALVGDVTRFAIRGRDVIISCFAGFIVGAGIFETIATVSAMSVGNSNFVLVMQGLGLLAPAAVMLVLALWNTADNNLYSASLAFTNASNTLKVRIGKPVWTLVSIVIAVLVAFAGLAAQFLVFLNIIALIAPPFAGVIIAHFWILTRGSMHARLLESAPAVRVEALVAWVVAAVLSKYTDLLLTDAIEGLVYGIVCYAVLGWVVAAVKRGAPATAAATREGEA